MVTTKCNRRSYVNSSASLHFLVRPGKLGFASAPTSFETCHLNHHYRLPNNDTPTFNGSSAIDLLSAMNNDQPTCTQIEQVADAKQKIWPYVNRWFRSLSSKKDYPNLATLCSESSATRNTCHDQATWWETAWWRRLLKGWTSQNHTPCLRHNALPGQPWQTSAFPAMTCVCNVEKHDYKCSLLE